jgi:endo-1,4-beta-xylanase
VRPTSLQTFAVVIGFGAIGCSAAHETSAVSAFGGLAGAAGAQVAGGGASTGGSVSAGGTNPSSGGTLGSGGAPSSGGTATGGMATGGAQTGGFAPTGGAQTGGFGPTGGTETGGSTGEVDCNAAMPTSGAQQHSGNGQGGSGNLAWQIWSNVGSGNMTTYSVPAFSASWNNSGDYLGRLGFEWGSSGGTYQSHGTITAEFVCKKSGSGGGYSYIGMYGWTNNPCVEWYIVDDSYNNMPVNPGNTSNKGEVSIDGGTYIMYTRNTSGTGGSRCSGVSNWIQYYSVRKTARDCGVISLTQHFDAWESLGMSLGTLLEAKILVETGGGSGTVDCPIANVMTTQ